MILTGSAAFGQAYVQTNLVSNIAGQARFTDPKLNNPWGLARGSGGTWFTGVLDAGIAAAYDGTGRRQPISAAIPPADPTNPATLIGRPSGVVFNGSPKDFLIGPGRPSTLLVATIEGTIAGWNAAGAVPVSPTVKAVTVVKATDGSAYTGLAIATAADGRRLLYAANFSLGRVDVFDTAFRRVALPPVPRDPGATPGAVVVAGEQAPAFVDSLLPANYHPFNVQTIGNDVVVTYALLPPGTLLETDGPGLGYVDIYSASGQLLRRLEHGDWLNAPWGVALAPLDFGRFSHDLLVGQFAGAGHTQSSGFIAAYDLATGRFDGLLQDRQRQPIAINGLFAISPGNTAPGTLDPAAAPAAQLYFTAGPNGGADGLVGYVSADPAELTAGNGQ
jgi:uncharacterized protein (TIGR03118 family)